jgi:hypothetical protein
VHPEGHVAQRNSKRRVAPLGHVVHPEGHVAQRNSKRRVAPLAHEVRPEGHVAIKGVDGVSLASPSLQCLCKTLSITPNHLLSSQKPKP